MAFEQLSSLLHEQGEQTLEMQLASNLTVNLDDGVEVLLALPFEGEEPRVLDSDGRLRRQLSENLITVNPRLCRGTPKV